MREKVLLAGEMNTSKTLSLISLAIIYPESRVVVLDPDDGCSKTLAELGVELPNLTIIPVTQDWEELMTNYQMAKGILKANDWLCFDMLGRFWDLAQQYYSIYVFGQSPIEHLLELRKQTDKVGFGGFEGLTDWTIIKRLHNEQLMDDAVIHSPFNVMATTSVNTYLPVEKVPKTGTQGIIASKFGLKIEGEKHNIYRFDTIAFLYRSKEGTYHYKLVRDRGRVVDLDKEFNITGKSFYEVYAQDRGLTL